MALNKQTAVLPGGTFYLSDQQIAARYAVSRGSIWRWVRGGVFPKPVKLGPGCTRWQLSAVQNWEAERMRAEK